ncbi:MAG TPA: universal stress protein [Streptosporangiaceae bacterium]
MRRARHRRSFARLAPPDARIVLLHVIPQEVPGAAHAYAGLLGRGHPERDPGRRVEELAATSAADLLATAAPAGPALHPGAAPGAGRAGGCRRSRGADLLILARDGDRSRLGPKSFGPAGRFVMDHAPCPVLLVWPKPPPGISHLPPAPPQPPRHRPGHR